MQLGVSRWDRGRRQRGRAALSRKTDLKMPGCWLCSQDARPDPPPEPPEGAQRSWLRGFTPGARTLCFWPPLCEGVRTSCFKPASQHGLSATALGNARLPKQSGKKAVTDIGVLNGYLPIASRVHSSKTGGGTRRSRVFQESEVKQSQTDGCERAPQRRLEPRVPGSKNNVFRTETGTDSRRWTEQTRSWETLVWWRDGLCFFFSVGERRQRKNTKNKNIPRHVLFQI